MLYRFIKTRKQLEGMEWLLAAVFVGSVTYTVYLIALSHVVFCGLPLAVATLFWTILIRRRRVLLLEFNDLPRKLRDTQARLFALDNDRPDSNPIGEWVDDEIYAILDVDWHSTRRGADNTPCAKS
jgi:hypothetical protein